MQASSELLFLSTTRVFLKYEPIFTPSMFDKKKLFIPRLCILGNVSDVISSPDSNKTSPVFSLIISFAK